MTMTSKCGKYQMIQDGEWITVTCSGTNFWMSKANPYSVAKLFKKWLSIHFEYAA